MVLDHLPDEMIDLLTRYAKDSPLRNPYDDIYANMQWIDALYYYKKRRVKVAASNLIVYKPKSNARVPTDTRFPGYFLNRKHVASEISIPVWDVDFSVLQVIYHKTRNEEYFDFEYTIQEGKNCIKRQMKRMIPWLYPDGGIHQLML